MKKLCIQSWYGKEVSYARIDIDGTEVKIQGDSENVTSIIECLKRNTTEVIYA